MNLVQHDKKYNNNDNTNAEVDSEYSFIASFIELYNKDLKLKNPLLVGLPKDDVTKMSGMGNKRYAQNVVNF